MLSEDFQEEITLPQDYCSFLSHSYWNNVVRYETQKHLAMQNEHGRGFATVFVLDTSESMASGGFQQMKNIFTSIVDEIGIYSDFGENIAVVTFGKTVKFVQYLSNNYEAVKKCLDNITCNGPSPLMAGLILFTTTTLAGSAQMDHWHVRPRVIVITDGRVTDPFRLDGPEDQNAYNLDKVKTELVHLLQQIGRRSLVTFIPVGDPDMSFLEFMTGIAKSARLVHPTDISQLGRYTSHMKIAVHESQRDRFGDLRKGEFHRVLQSMPWMTFGDEDVESIKYLICTKEVFRDLEELEDEITEGEDSEKISESVDCSIPVGTRVRRGPHWKWGNQDSDGPGTVVGYRRKGFVRIEWDNGHCNIYRYNAPSLNENIFDIVECSEPRVLIDGEFMAVGCLVRRGPDWKWDDQDGNEMGRIYKLDRRGIVHVRWPNGIKSNYRFGFDGKFDVQICEPFSSELYSSQHVSKEKAFSEECVNRLKTDIYLCQSDESNPDFPQLSNIPWSAESKSQSQRKNNLRNDPARSAHSLSSTTSTKKVLDSVKNQNHMQISNSSKVTPNNETDMIEQDCPLTECNTTSNKFEHSHHLIDEISAAELKYNNSKHNIKSGSELRTTSEFVWQWQNDCGKWITYPDDVCEIMNNRFIRNPKSTLSVELNNQCFRIDLSKLVQINTTTKARTEIRRLYPVENIK